MTTAFPFTTHESTPDGATESARLLDNRIRELRADINAIFGIPDNTQLTGPIGSMAANGAFAFATVTNVHSLIFGNSGDPTVPGQLSRNGVRLRFHNGSTVEYVDFPPGTRMVFDQAAAPVGWVRDTAPYLNDRMLRLSGNAPFVDGGSWVISGLFDAGHAHNISHVHNISHNHSLSNHTHDGNHTQVQEGLGTDVQLSTPSFAPSPDATGTLVANSGGPTADSAVGVSTIGSNGTWRPLSRDMIVAQKQ